MSTSDRYDQAAGPVSAAGPAADPETGDHPDSANHNVSVATGSQSDRPLFAVDESLPGVGFGPALHAEWLKLVSLRSTWWLSLSTLIMFVGFALLFGAQLGFLRDFGPPGEGPMDAEVISGAVSAVYFALITLGAVGVLAMTSEYGSGAIRSSLTAVPQRSTLFAAKTLALAVLIGLVSAVLVALGVLVTLPFAVAFDVVPSFTNPDVWWIVVSSAVAVVLTTMLAFGLGAILRSTAGGIVVFAVLVFVVPLVLQLVMAARPESDVLSTLMDIQVLSLFGDFTTVGEQYSVGAGVGLLVWAAVALLPGWFLFTRRDA